MSITLISCAGGMKAGDEMACSEEMPTPKTICKLFSTSRGNPVKYMTLSTERLKLYHSGMSMILKI